METVAGVNSVLLILSLQITGGKLHHLEFLPLKLPWYKVSLFYTSFSKSGIHDELGLHCSFVNLSNRLLLFNPSSFLIQHCTKNEIYCEGFVHIYRRNP